MLFRSVLKSVRSGAVANTLVLNSGNVGIGTTTPSYLLDVAGTANITGTASVGSLSASGSVQGASLNITGTASVGSLSSSGSVQGASLNITGTATVTGVLTGRTNVVAQSTSLNPVVAQTTYAIGANSITLTLPGSPTTGDRIGFRPASSSIYSYTVARNGNTIMGLSSDLTEIGRAHV